MTNSTLYILTAVHCDLKFTKKLLESIARQSIKNYELYLINDGSTDGTSDYVSSNYPKINLLKGDGNLWWTGSLNLGLNSILKKAKSNDYVFVINNDCYFDKNYLNSLINYSKKLGPKTIIGSTVVDAESKKVIDNGVKIDWSNLKFVGGGRDALSSKGTLYPVKVFKEIGLFDAKHFPHYFSDYEFTIRAKRNGYNIEVFDGGKIFNYSKRTGTQNLNFSKKSKLNIMTQINMLLFVCPKEYRLNTVFVLISKLLWKLKK